MVLIILSVNRPRYKCTDRFVIMDKRGKITRNMGVAAIATVAVVACLLFSYLTIGETDDGGQPRTVEELGDFVEYGAWRDTDEYLEFRITLVSMDDGEARYMLERNGEFIFTVTAEPELISNLAVKDTSGMDPVRQEYFSTIGGDILCDVYVDDTGTYLVSDGLIVKGETVSGTYIVYSTSMGQEKAPGTVSARSDLMPNDYIAVKYVTSESTTVMVDVIDSVDGDTVDISVIEYVRNGNVTERTEHNEEYGVGEYLENFFLSDDTQGGWTTDGSIVLLPTAMGNVLCNPYTLDGYRMWVGVEDNLAYRIDYGNGFTTTVIGTSLIGDAPSGFDRSPANTIGEGFSDTRSIIKVKTDGDGVFLFTSDTAIRHVESIDDGAAEVSIVSLPWGDRTTTTLDVEELSGRVDISELGEISGVAVLNTAFGTKLCLITSDKMDNVWSESEVDVFSDVEYMSVIFSDGSMAYLYLTDSDEVCNDRTYEGPMPGDAFMYRCEDSNGEVFDELYCVYYCDGLYYVAMDSDGFNLKGGMDDDMRYIGTETVTTAFGEMECRVYEVHRDYDMVRNVYMADGFVYPVYFEYTYEDYGQKGEIVYMSTM